MAGAFVASAVVYVTYYEAFDAFDGGVRQVLGAQGTAGIFATYPQPFLSTMGGFVDQVVGTALLMAGVLAVTDQRNNATPGWLTPVLVGGHRRGHWCGVRIQRRLRDQPGARSWAASLYGGRRLGRRRVHRCGRLVVGSGRGAMRRRDPRRPGLRPARVAASSTACGGGPMSRYVLALDQGTTSSRAIVFDRGGSIVSVAQEEFPQLFPGPGHVEHDPEAIWSTQMQTAREAMARAKATPADIAAIGVTNQRETTVLWERDSGRPVANAIVWQSRITAPICDRLKAAGHEPLFRKKTGLVVDAYFSGTKIKHLLDSHDGLRARAARGEILFGTVDSFLIWRLTGGRAHVTDVSNASRTLLFNIHTLEWDDELLRLLDVPRAMLPEVRSSSEVYGETDPTLFGAAIPIAGIAGDQQAALFGQACFEPGTAKNTYGTGCFMLLNTGDELVPSEKGLLTTVAWKIGGRHIVRARRLGLCRRRRGAVAARWLEGDSGVGRCRAPDERSGRHRRRLSRAGVCRTWRAVLGPARARGDRGPDAQLARSPTSRARRSTPWRIRRATCSR